MSNYFEFIAESRDSSGTIAARNWRRQDKIPAIIYGGDRDPEMIVVNRNEVNKSLEHEAVYSHILNVNVAGKSQKVLLKEVQRHPAKSQVLHLDFMRVDETHRVKMHVPLHFINESTCVGVKAGGVVTHAMVDVEVTCLPDALPEFLEVDLANVDLGGVLHLSDIKLPDGIEIPELSHGEDHDHPVAQVVKGKSSKEDSADSEPQAD